MFGFMSCRLLVLSRTDDATTLFIMAAEGCEEMSGNGELEESPGNFNER